MADDIDALRTLFLAGIAAAADLRALEALRVHALGKSGALTQLLKQLGTTPPDERRARGAHLNHLKDDIGAALDTKREELERAAIAARLASEHMDVSLPPLEEPPGLIHPISRTIEEMAAIFGAMGFAIAEGPDIETDWHNFGALNIPAHHPARADHDTFYLPPTAPGAMPPVLRTHTSPVQVRAMLERALPFRIVVMGRTYRADHDATHSPMFHQLEGLALDRDITLGHLKGCLIDFLRAYFGISTL